jgi:carbon storage regulator CsrA
MRFPNVFDKMSGTCRTPVGSVPTVTVGFWSLVWKGYTAMLVVSRKENQSIVFPALGISVNIVRAGGKTVRVGVDAPKDIRILRGELLDDTDHPLQRDRASAESESQHQMRNRLNKANLAIKLIGKQLAAGQVDAAEETLSVAIAALHETDQEIAKDLLPSDTRSIPNDGVDEDSRPKRALIVEDDPNERALLASYLRACGYEVDTAEDGHAALEYLSEQKPDAVVMDMQMPRLDGCEALREIRANDSLDDVKLFVVSGMDQDQTQVPSGDRGVQRWFQKPLSPEDLVNELAASLN